MDDQLDRLGVQLSEARRLAKAGGVLRGRIALLLVDNAAETLLRMSAEAYLAYADLHGDMVRSIERIPVQSAESEALLNEVPRRSGIRAEQQ